MRALVVENDGRLGIRDFPIPLPNDYQVLVRMISCGICNGTDLKLINRKLMGFDTYPAILGHEGVGTVVKKGKKVVSFEIGDNIIKPRLYEPIDGYYPGFGGFSEYGLVNDLKALAKDGIRPGTKVFSESEADCTRQIIPPDFDPISSAMINTFCEVLSAFRNFGFQAGESIVIFGCGAVGQTFTRFASISGLSPIIVCDIKEPKLKTAQAMGADNTINSKEEDVKKRVLEICPKGVDYVVDAVGCTGIINQGMKLIKFNGKICVYGISTDLHMQLDWSRGPHNWSLQFIQLPTYKDEAEALSQVIDWIKNGVLVQEDFITDVVDFDDVIDAFDLVMRGKAGKIIVKFPPPDDSRIH